MPDLDLTAAFADYDRTGALAAGSVRPRGIDLRVLRLPPSEIFRRMCRHLEFEVSEMSLGALVYLHGAGDPPLVALPAFPSRAFRHDMVYVRDGAGIERPEDLSGARIGIREWGMTAVVWIVGILAEEHGLDLASVDWVAAQPPRVPVPMPAGARVRPLPEGTTLFAALEAGDLDAVLSHQVPPGLGAPGSRVRRLFPNHRAAGLAYYRRTGVHPVMHCVVVRADVHRRHPWVARSLYDALCEARSRTLERILDTGAYAAMVPFLPAALEEARAALGEDYWPYGLEANRTALERLLDYAHRQALTPRRLAPEELFCETVRG